MYLAELIKSKAVIGADFLGIHTYTERKIGEPEGRWRHLLRGLQVVKDLMAKPLPFWSTEWGFWSTLLDPADNGHRARSRRAQAVMIVRELLVWRLAGMPENVYHTLADGCGDAADPECNFGLMTDASEDKPAMVAVETLDQQLRSLELTGILEQKDTLPPWLNVARFRGGGGVVLVAWISSPNMQLNLETPARATARDLYGDWVASGNTVFTLKYSDGPVYVTVPNGA